MGGLACQPGRPDGGAMKRGHRQPVQRDHIDEIVISTLANVEARKHLLSILEPLGDVLSAAREHAGTVPGEFLAAFIRHTVNDVLPQARQMLSEWLEQSQKTLPPQPRAVLSAQKISAESLHKLGEAFGNRSMQCPDLDDAFFEKLEAGHAFCPLCRGKIEGMIDTYWTVCQDKKKNRSRAKQWARKWRTDVAQPAASLAASLKASGALNDELWLLVNSVSPEVVAQLNAIATSTRPPPPRRNEPQGSQEPVASTDLTAWSVGYGLGHLVPALNRFADSHKIAKQRSNGGNARERRGSADDTDWLLVELANAYAIAGGSLAMRWDKREKTKIVGPFASFLLLVWEVLPPAGRPRKPETWVRRAKDKILPQLRTRADLRHKRCQNCALIALGRAGGGA